MNDDIAALDAELTAAAFGEGCDARLAGQRIGANPYHGKGCESLRASWDAGWMHVHRFWPGQMMGTPRHLMRWPVHQIPRIVLAADELERPGGRPRGATKDVIAAQAGALASAAMG